MYAASMAREMATRRAGQVAVRWVPLVDKWARRMILTRFNLKVGWRPAGMPARKSGSMAVNRFH